MSRRTDAGDERRAAILTAALDAFTERGYMRTTVRGIAARCGLTDAALYYYFPSKRALFETLVADVHEYPGGPAAGEEPAPRMSQEALARLTDAVLDWFVADDRVLRLLRRLSLEGDPLAREARAQRRSAWQEFLRRQFDSRFQEEDATLLADALVTFLSGLTILVQTIQGPNARAVMLDPAFRQRVHRYVTIAVPFERFLPHRAIGA
jgi:AcrR family transcriptional regulator